MLWYLFGESFTVQCAALLSGSHEVCHLMLWCLRWQALRALFVLWDSVLATGDISPGLALFALHSVLLKFGEGGGVLPSRSLCSFRNNSRLALGPPVFTISKCLGFRVCAQSAGCLLMFSDVCLDVVDLVVGLQPWSHQRPTHVVSFLGSLAVPLSALSSAHQRPAVAVPLLHVPPLLNSATLPSPIPAGCLVLTSRGTMPRWASHFYGQDAFLPLMSIASL